MITIEYGHRLLQVSSCLICCILFLGLTAFDFRNLMAAKPTLTSGESSITAMEKFLRDPKMRWEASESMLSTVFQSCNLSHSARRQQSFDRRRRKVESVFPADRRLHYQGPFLNHVHDSSFWYLHVWKSGGSTIAHYLGARHQELELLNSTAMNGTWFTFVRDPLDHFLSGWAECGYRFHQRNQTDALLPPDADYNDRILERHNLNSDV